MQHICDAHHHYLRAELPAIWDLLREARGTRQGAPADLRRFGRLFALFRSTLESHLRKEEEILFPMIERLESSARDGATIPAQRFGQLARPIEVLEGEHAFGDALVDQMRPLWQAWAANEDPADWRSRVSDRMRRLEADMQRHVHLEDAILFPRTIHLEASPWLLPAALR